MYHASIQSLTDSYAINTKRTCIAVMATQVQPTADQLNGQIQVRKGFRYFQRLVVVRDTIEHRNRFTGTITNLLPKIYHIQVNFVTL